MRSDPYRVIVWGPGVLGNALIREMAKKPEFEIVGVLAYSEDKSGKDAGELAGAGAIGVAITTDQEEIFALDADVALICVKTTAPVDLKSDTTQSVVRFLEKGVNVVSAPAYQWAHLHGQELVDTLEQACRTGNATLHSTGINPGLLNERWTVGFTAAMTEIDHIKVQEINDNSHIDSKDMMLAIGYGQEPNYEVQPIVMALGKRYYHETLLQTMHILGHEVERIEDDFEWLVADKDYSHVAVDVPKGTINGIIHRYHAVANGRRFMTLEEIFYGSADQCPVPEVTGGDMWTILIEGKPTSLRAVIDMKASIEENRAFADGDTTLPAYYATAVPMLQAIPLVVGGEPGIVYPHTFTTYRPDLRELEPQNTTV
jgi:4-hydroxy-tetrahydrodipicolinate reductase